MNTPIRLHWASSKPNFGDQLSPLLCEHLSGRPVRHAKPEHCDLIAVGSILHRLSERCWNRSVDVWGTGRLEARPPRKSKHRYHAVRGRLTAATVTNHEIAAFGDPGLLADRLLASLPAKRHTLGVVPHYSERDHPETKALRSRLPDAVFIDVFEEPLTVIEKIASCHFILSSSLHGLVVADAFGLPNLWMRITGNLRGRDWKFFDYYSVFKDIQPQAIQANSIHSFADTEARFECYERPGIERIKQKLAQAFPY